MIKKICYLLTVLVAGYVGINATALAGPDLIVATNRDGIKSPDELFSALGKLTQSVVFSSTCSASSQVSSFVSIPDAPYYGVVMVRIYSSCKEAAATLYSNIESDKRFSIYSNGNIDPYPVVSAGN